MTPQELQSTIAAGLPCQHLEVSGDGRHWSAVIVSAEFEGKRPIARHQRVYATLGGRIKTDADPAKPEPSTYYDKATFAQGEDWKPLSGNTKF